jgi:Zn-dependent protease
MSIQFVIALFEFAILLFSLSLHECAHGWMASRLGDQTARMQGQITMNPVRHIDLLGTIVFPLLMAFGPMIGLGGGLVFGWSKPTPVMSRNFKHIRRDENLTALAGPAANLLLVIVSMLALVVVAWLVPGGALAVDAAMNGSLVMNGASAPQAIALLGYLTILVNLALIIFNFIPIPPLDAGTIVRNMLPYNSLNTFDTIARFGFIVIFIVGRIVVTLCIGPPLAMVNWVLVLLLPHLSAPMQLPG